MNPTPELSKPNGQVPVIVWKKSPPVRSKHNGRDAAELFSNFVLLHVWRITSQLQREKWFICQNQDQPTKETTCEPWKNIYDDKPLNNNSDVEQYWVWISKHKISPWIRNKVSIDNTRRLAVTNTINGYQQSPANPGQVFTYRVIKTWIRRNFYFDAARSRNSVRRQRMRRPFALIKKWTA